MKITFIDVMVLISVLEVGQNFLIDLYLALLYVQ